MSFYAPAPGSRSGVADYAVVLHAKLAALHPPDVPLYHLGNNRLHLEIYRRALRHPGVIVLHDAVLHHLLLGALEPQEYVEEFVYNYGEWNRGLADELWRERGASAVDPRYFRYPMLKRIVADARGIIVHNEGAASLVLEHGGAKPAVVPHFFESPGALQAGDAERFRQRLGIAPGATLFGIFGYLRETKRVLPSLRAFGRLHEQRPNTALLVAGEAASPDLERLLAAQSSGAGVFRLPHLSECELGVAAAAIDCCINLRFPAAGETSGIAIRMMGGGKPVIVSDIRENSDFPGDACLRVSPGVAEAGELLDHMILVSEFPQLAREIGNNARRHILRHHSPGDAARRYQQVLCAASSSQPS